MNDHVPTMGESEGTTVPASQPSTIVSQDSPQLRRSESLTGMEASPVPTQPVPGEAAVRAPESVQDSSSTPTSKPPPVIAQGPAASTPTTPAQRAVDIMPPAMPSESIPKPVPVTGGVWEPDLERSATSTGVSASLMRKIAGKESNYDVNARAGTSSAAGLFQITGPTWDDLRACYGSLGLTDRLDPRQQARVAPYYMKEIQDNLHRALGRAPNDTESYLGWFLGPQGSAMALRADPGMPVSQVLDPKAIAANPGVFKNVRTVGELYQWAAQKMGDTSGASHPQPAIDLTPYLNLGPHSAKDGAKAISGLQWNLQSRLANMVAAMPPELQKHFKINSAYRSPETQAGIMSEKIGGMLGAQKRASWDADVASLGAVKAGEKWATELRAHGITRWVGLPGGSNHQKGNAVDLGYGNEETKKWIHANAARFGLGFPMAHEPWHIEALGGMESRLAQQGVPRDYNFGGRRVPYTTADDMASAKAQESQAYSLVQAAAASVQQDWMISNALKREGKVVYDPGFSVSKDMLQREDIKSLPENYLSGIAEARSQQDFDHRVKMAVQDAERERRLSATSGGTLIRMATAMADPAALALSVVAPVGFAAKAYGAGRLGMVGAAAADGAIGGLAAEVPAIMNKPGYETEQAVFAAALGSAGYLALNRQAWMHHPAAPEMERAITGMTKLKDELNSGVALSDSSVGAATVKGYRDAVRDDVAGLNGLVTEKSGAAWMDKVRFDVAKLKNSENTLLAKATDLLVQDPIGNRDKTKAVTRPIEYDARMMEEKPNVQFARTLQEASTDYRKRNNVSFLDWQRGGEEDFLTQAGRAARNTDPTAEFDPAVVKLAGAWRKTAQYFHELGQNPGKERGTTLAPLAGAEHWDATTYVPRYTNWDKFNTLNAEFGNGLKQLFTEGFARANPDLDYKLAQKVGEAYYTRLAKVEGGQEFNVQKAMSGADMESLRRMLADTSMTREEIEQVLFQAEKKEGEGKTLTSRQKRRTLMDENFSLILTGRNGQREVHIGDLWEDNLHSIQHAYSKQMSGTIALANFQIENPQWHPTKNPDVPRYIVDGIRSDGDWNKFLDQVRAHDNEVRYADRLATVEGEIKQLQWVYDTLRGIPRDMDRTKLGQFLRVVQNVNFIRLMSQAGWSSIAEFGTLLGNVGLKHMMSTIPSVREVFRDIYLGKLPKDELLDLERTFTAGTDHLRGTGMTWTGKDVASALNDSSKMSARLDTAERITKKASRYTSMVSLAPLTTFQEKWALQAALSKFKGAALRGEKLNEQRMRLIGLDAEMQGKVLKEIEKHNGTTVVGERGNQIETLGLDKWDPQTRSAFEYAINTWVRRIIQQNDLGQMNAMIGSTLGKVLFQFRNFTLGAWSKQTLSSIHHADNMETWTGFMASMLIGSMAFAVQRALGGIGLPEEERKKQLEKDLGWDRLVAAGFQRAGPSSLMPGVYDFAAGMAHIDPFFDTRSTNQPTQGLMANPTTGLIDSLYTGVRTASRAIRGEEEYTSKDFRNASRAFNVLHNYPIMMQLMNASSGAFASQ